MTWWRGLTWPRRIAVALAHLAACFLAGLALGVQTVAAVIAIVTVLAGRVIVLAVMSAHRRR